MVFCCLLFGVLYFQSSLWGLVVLCRVGLKGLKFYVTVGPLMKIRKRKCRKRYLGDKKVYAYDRLSLDFPVEFHNDMEPFLGKDLARKLKNPRIRGITFHTFRHFKATMEYHKTKDILHVMRILGHKNIKNTLVYTQLVDFQDDDYVSRVAKTIEEACQLIEAGFEYVCEMDDVKIFRRRK